MIPVELAPEVVAAVRKTTDRREQPPRCGAGVIRSAVAGADVALRPETTRRVPLDGWGPDSVLAALGIAKPLGVELECSSEDLGQGETETSHRHQWTDNDRRSILAEEIKTEIYDGATPYSTYVRGVIIDGDRGVLLTGRLDSALSIEG